MDNKTIGVRNSDGTWTFEHIRIGFKNFGGKESAYNTKGSRNFCIFFEGADDLARKMEKDVSSAGDKWNIKWTKPNEDGVSTAYLPCNIKFGKFNPPTICLCPSTDISKQTMVTEENIHILDTFDWIDIQDNCVDLTIRPFDWTMKDGRHGRKAMVKELYVVNHRSRLEEKYGNADIQEPYSIDEENTPF